LKRVLALRAAGLVVAAIVLIAATQFLLHGFETDPLLDAEIIADLSDWITRPPRQGAALLAGTALIILAAGLGWLTWTTRAGHQPVITTRRKNGWTKVDRKTLTSAVTRRLERIDQRSDLDVTIDRRGRVDLHLVTPDPSVGGPLQDYRDAIDEEVARRHLPIRSTRATVTQSQRSTGRRRVR
jgi:hypothetical protein